MSRQLLDGNITMHNCRTIVIPNINVFYVILRDILLIYLDSLLGYIYLIQTHDIHSKQWI
jgi:hypothetical protein